MSFNFANPLDEVRFTDLNEALAFLDANPTADTTASTDEIKMPSLAEIRFPDGSTHAMTKSAFVQLLHFLHLNWEDVKDVEPRDVHADVKRRLKAASRQLAFRTRGSAIHAVLSAGYTPVTNSDLLQGAISSFDLSNASVTLYRGRMRLTGVSESLTFQPQVGDIISGGWELVNDDLGKAVLNVNTFLLRLVCSNGAVVRSGGTKERIVHRGWDRGGLLTHVRDLGSQAVARMDGVGAALQRATETQIGRDGLLRLSQMAASPLGRKGLQEMTGSVSADSSVYDVYNHLTFVSQQRPLGPRRQLEMVAGSLLAGMK
ncbi:hypothetical protein [Alicyclobacillus sp. ALC3]|uniref:hypothetical protein n=1 Tax=Alicyclobacillus sp. ALC3 TaxID=2796143 RepID=UPI00237935CD|nr:hypothetical protein [Alicyclobacillus sp. ALC3]WDL99182.1 hypothetical protein JC200_11375 [Alicyclobacillus sp. ALC3]